MIVVWQVLCSTHTSVHYRITCPADKGRVLGGYGETCCPYPHAVVSVDSLTGDWLSMEHRIGPRGVRGREGGEERLLREEEDISLCGGLHLRGSGVKDSQEEWYKDGASSSKMVERIRTSRGWLMDMFDDNYKELRKWKGREECKSVETGEIGNCNDQSVTRKKPEWCF